jgi:hypothetical protein
LAAHARITALSLVVAAMAVPAPTATTTGTIKATVRRRKCILLTVTPEGSKGRVRTYGHPRDPDTGLTRTFAAADRQRS